MTQEEPHPMSPHPYYQVPDPSSHPSFPPSSQVLPHPAFQGFPHSSSQMASCLSPPQMASHLAMPTSLSSNSLYNDHYHSGSSSLHHYSNNTMSHTSSSFTDYHIELPSFNHKPGLYPLATSCIKQEPGLPPIHLKQESVVCPQGSHIKQEPGVYPQGPYIKQEPGIYPQGPNEQEPGVYPLAPHIKQEPGVYPQTPHIEAPLKQEPRVYTQGAHIKQEPGVYPQSPYIKQEPGVYPQGPYIKQEPGVYLQGPHINGPEQQPKPSLGCTPFPSEPINLEFLTDIEDIVTPGITIEDIKGELSYFEGPSDMKRTLQKRVEEDEPPWIPPLWQQQYENIRTMRAKRDAPVDKYGCFMNAEKGVAPKVRRYQVLVSLMLSSQTKDEIVGKAMAKLKENGLTIDAIIDTPQEEIARMIFPVGFWNKKADYIKKTTKILREKFNGDIPQTVEGLVSLPGIGPKMAHLIMDFAWGEVSGIAVDTHVHRISHRLGWMKKELRSPEEARKALEKWFPKSEWSDLNLLFVGFGQQVCSPVGPKCSECLNKDLCPSSSCLVSSGLPLGIGIELTTKSRGKRSKNQSDPGSKKIKSSLHC